MTRCFTTSRSTFAGKIQSPRHVADDLTRAKATSVVIVEAIDANDREGTAAIVDLYDFGRKGRNPGRPVRNRITSRFVFQNGEVPKQFDDCDPRAWAEMAIGGAKGACPAETRPIRWVKANWKLYQFVQHNPASIGTRSNCINCMRIGSCAYKQVRHRRAWINTYGAHQTRFLIPSFSSQRITAQLTVGYRRDPCQTLPSQVRKIIQDYP